MPLPAIRFVSDQRLLVLIALCLISYFVNLGKAPVYILDEAKNAQCAREMLQHNNWIVPTFNEQIRTDKPPLHYFAMALAYRTGGISPYTARFFSAVCGLLLVIFTYLFVLRFSNAATAFLSGLILLSSWHFTFEMRLSVPDPYLILILTSAFYCFFIYHTSGPPAQKYLWLFYVLLGLGVLSKGPIAVILPFLVITLFLIVQHRFNFSLFKHYKVFWGIGIILLVCLPWYILVHIQTHGEWTRGFFIKNNLKRFVRVKEKHGGFFLLSAAYVLVGMMPVTFFLTSVVKYIRQVFTTNLLVQYAAIITTVVIVFFTLSHTQLPNYPIPCYPFIAIIAAFYFNHLFQKQLAFKISLWLLFAFSCCLPVAVFAASRLSTSFSAFPYLWLPLLIAPAGMIVTLLYNYKTNKQRFTHTLSAMLLTFMAMAWILNLYVYPKIFSSNPVTRGIQMHRLHEPLVAFHIYNPAFNFYLRQPVKRIEDFEQLKAYLAAHPDCQVLTRAKNLKQLGGLNLHLYFMQQDNFESNTTCLLEQK